MDCTHCQELLGEYQDATLAQETRASIAAHLATCTACAAAWQRLQTLAGLLALDADVEPSPAFEARVLEALAAERRAGRQSLWHGLLARAMRPLVWGPVLGATAALAVFVLLPHTPSDDELFVAEHAEMLGEMDLLQNLDAVEDFAVIAAIGEPAGKGQ